MMWGKQNDVLDWLAGDNIEKLDISDQFRIVMAYENFINDIKSIMEKELKKDEKHRIDRDSFFKR